MSSLKFYRLGFYPLRRDESVNIQLCTLYSKKQQQQQQQTQKGYFFDKHNIWRSLERRSWKNEIPGKAYFREILKGTNSSYKENLHPAYIPFAFSKEMVKVNILSKKFFLI